VEDVDAVVLLIASQGVEMAKTAVTRGPADGLAISPSMSFPESDSFRDSLTENLKAPFDDIGQFLFQQVEEYATSDDERFDLLRRVMAAMGAMSGMTPSASEQFASDAIAKILNAAGQEPN
jgi:hypothetical protein